MTNPPAPAPADTPAFERWWLAATALLWAAGHLAAARGAASYEHLGELTVRLDALDAGTSAAHALGSGSLGVSGGGVGFLALHAVPRSLDWPLESLQAVYAGLDATAIGLWLVLSRGLPGPLRWGVALLAATDPAAKVWLVENSTVAGLAVLPLLAALAAPRPHPVAAAVAWAVALHCSLAALFVLPVAGWALRRTWRTATVAFGAGGLLALAPAVAGWGDEAQNQVERLAPALDPGQLGETLLDVGAFFGGALAVPAIALAATLLMLRRHGLSEEHARLTTLGLLGCLVPLAVVDRGGFGDAYRLAIALPFAWLAIAGAWASLGPRGRGAGVVVLGAWVLSGLAPGSAPTVGEELESGDEGCRLTRIAELKERMPADAPWGSRRFVGSQSACLEAARVWERHAPDATALLLPAGVLPGGRLVADLALHDVVPDPEVSATPNGPDVVVEAPAGPPLLVAFRRSGQREGPIEGPVVTRCDLEPDEPGVPEQVCAFDDGYVVLAASTDPVRAVFRPPPGEAATRLSLVGAWRFTRP